MVNLSDYKNIINPLSESQGKIHQNQSDMLLELTWNRDMQSKVCYIYDYYHDSEQNKNINLNPKLDLKKTRIDAKYIVTQYGTLAKDQVEYHLMFKPSQLCPLDYYKENFIDKYDAEFPIGLYIDIPDNRGIYRRWLICDRDLDLQFITYTILPCNYYFHWINKNMKMKMWGVARLHSSYNSGIGDEGISFTVENQNQIWIPSNEYSDSINYVEDGINKRIIISGRKEEPLTWKVSKIENLHPIGINKITVIQTKFDENKDLIVPLNVSDSVYEMYADFYNSSIEPEVPIEPIEETEDYSVITTTGTPPQIKIGGGYKVFTVNFLDKDGNNVNINHNMFNDNWSFVIEDEEVNKNILLTDYIENSEDGYYSVKLKFYDSNNCPQNSNINYNDYSNKIMTVSISDDLGQCLSNIEVELISV